MDAATREILVGMKEQLSKGWIQGKLIGESGVCLFGAICKVGNPLTGLVIVRANSDKAVEGRNGNTAHAYAWHEDTPVGFAINAISEKVGVHYNQLAKWNDAPERTVDDIVNVIDSILLEDATIEETKTGKKAVHV